MNGDKKIPLLDQEFLRKSLAPVDIEERRRFEELLIRYDLKNEPEVTNIVNNIVNQHVDQTVVIQQGGDASCYWIKEGSSLVYYEGGVGIGQNPGTNQLLVRGHGVIEDTDAHTYLELRNLSTTAWDTKIIWSAGSPTATAYFSMGMDDSDINKFKIARGSDLAANNLFIINPVPDIAGSAEFTVIDTITPTAAGSNSYRALCGRDGYIYASRYTGGAVADRIEKYLEDDPHTYLAITTSESGWGYINHLFTDGVYVYAFGTHDSANRLRKYACSTLALVTESSSTHAHGGACYNGGLLYIVKYGTTQNGLQCFRTSDLGVSWEVDWTNGTGDNQTDLGSGIATDGSYLYVRDSTGAAGSNNRIIRCTMTGTWVDHFDIDVSTWYLGLFQSAFWYANGFLYSMARNVSSGDYYILKISCSDFSIVDSFLMVGVIYQGFNKGDYHYYNYPSAPRVIRKVAGVAAAAASYGNFTFNLPDAYGDYYEMARITSNRRLGVNTASPLETIDALGNIKATQGSLISSCAIGTIPVQVTSTTMCANLNADMWDGYHQFMSSTLEPNGFPNRTDTSLSWSDAQRTLTLTGTNFTVWKAGIQYTLNTDSFQIPDTSGLYFFYLTPSGATLDLTASTDFPGFNSVLVASVYWNTTAGMDKGLAADERHGIVMDAATHEYLHETVGCRFESGLGGTFTDTTFSIDAGYIHDEDIDFQITPAKTTCDVLYKDGSATWKWLENQTVYYYTSGGSLYYNNGTTLSAVGANQYVAAWIFASTGITRPIIAIIGQRVDTTLADARNNNKYESLSLGTLPFKEMKLLYRVILRNDITPYEEALDMRSVSNLSTGTFVATAHNTLTGLATGDDHTQYSYCKVHATDAPGVNDDLDLYRVGTIWIEQDADKAYVCVDNSDGAAVWTEIGSGGASALDDLTDVNAPAPNNGDTIVWDSVAGEWVADAPGVGALALDDLSDVNAPAPNDGDVLTWDDGAGEWVAAAPAGGPGALALDDLTDVDAAAPNNGDIIQYNSATGNWEAEALPAGANHDLLSATHADTTASAVSRGSLIYGNSTPKWAELSIGTNGYWLRSDGTDVAWAELTAARLPTHASAHQSGGGDAIKLDDLSAPDDNTDLNATASRHGLMPKVRNFGDIMQVNSDGTPAWRLPWGNGYMPITFMIIDEAATTFVGRTLTWGGTALAYSMNSYGHWRATRTATTASTSSSIAYSAAFVEADQLPSWHARYQVGYGATYNSISAMHSHIGFFSGTQAEQAALSFEGACFNYSSASSANWIARSRDAAVEETTDTGVAVAAGAHHDFAIIFSAATTIKFYIDGVLVATHSTRYPAATTGLLISHKIWTSENVGKSHALTHCAVFTNG